MRILIDNILALIILAFKSILSNSFLPVRGAPVERLRPNVASCSSSAVRSHVSICIWIRLIMQYVPFSAHPLSINTYFSNRYFSWINCTIFKCH